MTDIIASNELYFVVLPMVHVGGQNHGLTEQVLTLMPDKNFATRFFADELSGYVATFNNRIAMLIGGHVKGFEIHPEIQDDKRLIVRVVQNVG
jgi:hypothetical protein